MEGREGINMGPVDMLSRKDEVDTNNDNWEVTLLKGNNWDHHIKALDSALVEKLTTPSPSDPIITKALEAMHDQPGQPWILRTAKEDWEYTDSTLYFKKCLYVPKSAQHNLVKSLHESLAGGC